MPREVDIHQGDPIANPDLDWVLLEIDEDGLDCLQLSSSKPYQVSKVFDEPVLPPTDLVIVC